YWLGREIYQYDQSMGITMMGGFMSWLWVIQAFLIAVLFLAGNYYLWIGMGRIPGAERYRPYTKYLLIVLVLGAIVWGTPHTMIANSKELAAMGGSHHPLLGALGVMSAKNSAVNLMILATFLSFLMYRRGNKQLVVPWAATGTKIQAAMFALAIRAVHPRGHVHLAHGADGLRPLRDPPVLARVAGHGGHEQVRRHPGPGLRLADDQPLRAHLPRARGFRVLAGRARREVDL